MGDWDSTMLSGPEGEDWRVPVSELTSRLERLAQALRVAALPGALQDAVARLRDDLRAV